jgi:hypothetical protein
MILPAAIEPNSTQLNAEDFPAGTSVVVKITRVTKGPNDKQAWDLHLEGYQRVYRPCMTMRRVMITCWRLQITAADGSQVVDLSPCIGRRLELYTDPTVRFGAEVAGGIRIRAMSDIAKPHSVALTETKTAAGVRKKTWTINVLPDAPKPQQPSTKSTDLPKFVAAVPGIAPGLTVPLLREYMTATASIDIDTLSASELSAVVADIKQPAEVERLVAWLAARGGG